MTGVQTCALPIYNVRPADDEFVTAEVTRLSEGQIAKVFPSGQPVPE